jgi:hypothetical protein
MTAFVVPVVGEVLVTAMAFVVVVVLEVVPAAAGARLQASGHHLHDGPGPGRRQVENLYQLPHDLVHHFLLAVRLLTAVAALKPGHLLHDFADGFSRLCRSVVREVRNSDTVRQIGGPGSR